MKKYKHMDNKTLVTLVLFFVAIAASFFAVKEYIYQYQGVQEAWQFASINRGVDSSSDVSTEDASAGCIAEPSYNPQGQYTGCHVWLRDSGGSWHEVGAPASVISEQSCKTFCSSGSNNKKLQLWKDFILYEKPSSDLK